MQWSRSRDNPKVNKAIARHNKNKRKLGSTHPKALRSQRRKTEEKEMWVAAREAIKVGVAG